MTRPQASGQERSYARDSCFCPDESFEYEWPVRLTPAAVLTSHGHGEITIRSRNVAVTVIPGVYVCTYARMYVCTPRATRLYAHSCGYASWKVRARTGFIFIHLAPRKLSSRFCRNAAALARELAPIDSFVRCGRPRLSVSPAILLFR